MEDSFYFVSKRSVVRKIWGKPDIILFIFAGAAAEFALNKAVDWLYFTGRLPADPLGRLFSTVSYARRIIFSDKAKAFAAIDSMRNIHAGVESARGAAIPDWAYRDVLFLLIHYSIASFELLERRLTAEEREEVVKVFCEVGARMGLQGLPENYNSWLHMYIRQADEDLEYSHYTEDLFKQYRKHLGAVRYALLLQCQNMVIPDKVRRLLKYRKNNVLQLPLITYKACRTLHLDRPLISLVLPAGYTKHLGELYNN